MADLKTVVIKNNLTTDIFPIELFGNSNNPSVDIYERDIMELDTSAERCGVKANASDTFTFYPIPFLEAVDATGGHYLVITAGRLYPVKVVYCIPDANGNFADITVDPVDVANMQNAEKFHKYICAFPSSDLTSDYKDALQANENNTDYDWAGFFKNHGYDGITNEMITAISTYYNVFPHAWLDYQQTKTYYLYSGDENNQYNLIHQGSLTLNWNGGISFDKRNICIYGTFTDANGKVYTINYSETDYIWYVTDATNNVNLNLRGFFQLKSDLTGVATDNVVSSLLIGSLNNNPVFGWDQAPSTLTPVSANTNPGMATPSLSAADITDGSGSGMGQYVSNFNVYKGLQLFLLASSITQGLELIVKYATKIYNKVKGIKETSLDDIKADADAKYRDIMKRLGTGDTTIVTDVTNVANTKSTEIINAVQDPNSALLQRIERGNTNMQETFSRNVDDKLTQLDTKVQQLMELKNTENLSNIEGKIFESYTSIQDALGKSAANDQEIKDRLTALEQANDTASKSISDLSTQLKTEADVIKAEVNAENAEAIEQLKNDVDKLKQLAEEDQETKDKGESDNPTDIDIYTEMTF
ncbi:MAG: hypothetical protein QM802_18260 [Agriterribacter sp.]